MESVPLPLPEPLGDCDSCGKAAPLRTFLALGAEGDFCAACLGGEDEE